jgi:hypothetical protein
MARKISGGLVGEPSVGAINVAPTAVLTTALNQDIGFANNIILNAQNDIRFADADSSNWVAFQAPSSITSDVTWTLPSTDGSSNQVLTTNGAGILSWTTKDISITNNTIDSNINYIVFSATTSGSASPRVSDTGLTFQPSTGTLTVTNIVESSSIVYKENVLPISNALDDIMKLVGVTYDRKDGSAKGEAGLIAERVNEVLPNLVTKDKHGNPLGINYTKFSAYLIEAVKTLKTEIDEIKGIK